MSASICIPNVHEPAFFDTNLHEWVARKHGDVIPVFTEMVSELSKRMNSNLNGLKRVEFYGVESNTTVHVKFIRGENDSWQQKWLFDLAGGTIFFFPNPD
ncbi:MAG: hypothetical protein Q7R93_00080 [bacterium]|nr:hypothetical protein [bacterium]